MFHPIFQNFQEMMKPYKIAAMKIGIICSWKMWGMDPEQRLSSSLPIEACMLFCIGWMPPWVTSKRKCLISDIEIFRTCKKETLQEASALSKMYIFKFYNYNFYNYNLFVMTFNIFQFMVNWVLLEFYILIQIL